MNADNNNKPDPWATDTADPARIFNEMFPPGGHPAADWRLFSAFEDMVTRGVIRVERKGGVPSSLMI